MAGAPRAAQARALYPRALRPCTPSHPPFTPAYLPACSRSLWGSVDPGCGSPCREKCSRRLWSLKGFTRPAAPPFPQGVPSPAVLASLVLVPAGLRRCPPKGSVPWHPVRRRLRFIESPSVGRGRVGPSPTQQPGEQLRAPKDWRGSRDA